jgi:hypothetical protein
MTTRGRNAIKYIVHFYNPFVRFWRNNSDIILINSMFGRILVTTLIKCLAKRFHRVELLTELRFVAPPPKWKLQTAPGAASGLELPTFTPFGRAPVGAYFGDPPNRPVV